MEAAADREGTGTYTQELWPKTHSLGIVLAEVTEVIRRKDIKQQAAKLTEIRLQFAVCSSFWHPVSAVLVA